MKKKQWSWVVFSWHHLKDSGFGIFVWQQYLVSLCWSAITAHITWFYPGKLFVRYFGKYSKSVVSCGKVEMFPLYNMAPVIPLKQH